MEAGTWRILKFSTATADYPRSFAKYSLRSDSHSLLFIPPVSFYGRIQKIINGTGGALPQIISSEIQFGNPGGAQSAAHIGQGSSVTNILQPARYRLPVTAAAASSAHSSACPVIRFAVSLVLEAEAMISFPRTMTQPTGISHGASSRE